MYSKLQCALMMVASVIIAVSVSTIPTRAADESKDLQSQIDKLKKQVNKLQAKLAYMRVEDAPINGLAGPHVIFEGCNVHVRSGSGDSSDGTFDLDAREAIPDTTPLGLGNLLVGYNEEAPAKSGGRGGSHNLIIGARHSYPNVGGLVLGQASTISGAFATVTGGIENTSNGAYSSVSGGIENTASGIYSSVSGGFDNSASGSGSSVSGGDGNSASGVYSSVSGGLINFASGIYSSVSGGFDNTASVSTSSVSGGVGNTASGNSSSVSGGSGNTASGSKSSVSGGHLHAAPGLEDWVAGGLFQEN